MKVSLPGLTPSADARKRLSDAPLLSIERAIASANERQARTDAAEAARREIEERNRG